jgi:hypothetical protein
MSDVQQVRGRPYLDALNLYESVTKEAVDLARRTTYRHTLLQRGIEGDYSGANPDISVEDVMRRWHYALVDVLRAWEAHTASSSD